MNNDNKDKKILLVDDDPGNIEVLGGILSDVHEIIVANDGPNALAVIQSNPPDLILLDVLMPGMDGFEVCRRLKAAPRHREIPVIFLTSLDDATDEARALELGAVDFLTKPVNPPVVLARVRTHLELKDQRDHLHALSHHLEELVERRTSELKASNLQLRQEIRERKKAEERLEASRSRLLAIVETALEGIITIHADGVIESVNPAVERIFGYGAAELVGQNVGLLMESPHRENHDVYIQRYLDTGQGPVIGKTLELRAVRKDGQVFPLELSVARIHLGQGDSFLGVLRDISERKKAEDALRESEEKLRFLFENSPDHIMLVDPTGLVLFCNRTRQSPFPELAPGRPFFAALPPAAREQGRHDLARVVASGQPDSQLLSGTDDTWWEIRLAPLGADGGAIEKVLLVSTDVTEKRTLKLQAIRNARLASIGVLAASVAHEINNPNNSLRFAASSLERLWQDAMPVLERHSRHQAGFALAGVPAAEGLALATELLDALRNNSDRIKSIVLNLKHLSRKDEGRMDQKVPIPASLQAAVSVLQNQIIKHTDHFVLDLPAAPLPPVRGNPQQLEQVWINLIHNALQALPDRKKGVSVAVGLDEARQAIQVTVRDEGVGISREDQDKIATPFFTTKTEAEGIGLGLYISRMIVEHHEGTLDFQSAPGTGTTVTTTLPLHGRSQWPGISPP
ncbi:MAG: PAS domain S-box protein [Magnetococcales bacterium]|nr:PAS domain S-box protein [Magnetococcales bacterium]